MKSHTRTILSAGLILLLAPALQAQFSTPLVLPGDTTVGPPAGDQQNVTFARGAGQSLMVWEDNRASLAGTQSNQGYGITSSDVYAARIDDLGNPIDITPIAVATGPFSQSRPKAAWNGENWLVVWMSRTPSPFTTTEGIYGARVTAGGQVLDDPPILIYDTLDFDEREPVVASDGSNWAVIWKGGIAFATEGVLGSLVSPAGVPDAPRTFFTTVNGVGYYIPWNIEMAYAGGRYLMVSEHMPQGGSFDRIFGQRFDASLTKVGGEFAISTGPSGFGIQASIAANGTEFFVDWLGSGGIRGTPVTPAGAVIVGGGTLLSPGVLLNDPHTTAGWDGANWIAAWDGSGPTYVARVSTAGALLAGSPFAASAGSWGMQLPAVATLGNGALVAWADMRNFVSPIGPDTTDIYGAVIDTTGALAPSQLLTLAPPAQTRPDVAGSAAGGYLVAFLSETAGTASVMAQRVNAFGFAIDPQPIVLASGTRWVRNPAVAWDGTQWLVVWDEANGAWPPGSGDVYARRVGANGVPIDPAPIHVMSGNTPDVAAAGGMFLVICSVEPINHTRYIRGARVRGSDGAVLDATPIQIGASYAIRPSVAAFADRWVIAYEFHNTHDETPCWVYVNFVLLDGTPQIPVLAGSASNFNTAPALAAGDTTALLSWADSSDVRARRIQSDGTLLDSIAGFLVSNAFNKQFAPDAGWDGTRWLVGFNDYRAHTSLLDGAVGDLYGARVEADGTVVDPAGLAIADDFSVAEANPAIAGDFGIALVAYTSLHEEIPYGTFRITLRSLDGSGAFSPFCYGDGSGSPCPCANSGASGRGCENSATTGGALLSASGAASLSADTLSFTSSDELATVLSVFLQGNAVITAVNFGDGLRCVGGSLSRLYQHNAIAGTVISPQAGDLSVSARSAAVGDTIAAGEMRWYQVYYRDPNLGFCALPEGNTWNISSGIQVQWSP